LRARGDGFFIVWRPVGIAKKVKVKNLMTNHPTISATAALTAWITLFAPIHVARADIFQWEYINPAVPSEGRRESATLVPDGVGANIMRGSNLAHRNLTKAYLIGADLSPIYDFETYIPSDLTGANLSQADLTNARLWNAYLFHADFRQANLTNAYCRTAHLAGANLTGAVIQGANLQFTTISQAQIYSTASYQARDLSGVLLSGAQLPGLNLAGQNLINADLSQANLTNADFSTGSIDFYYVSQGLTTNLMGTNLSQANLTNANFSGVDAYGPEGEFYPYVGANLDGANLSGADTRGANFYLASLNGANTSNMIQSGGHIAGLDLRGGASLGVRDYDRIPAPHPAPTGPIPIVVDERLTMDSTSWLILTFDADAWDSTISFAPGVPVALGGTLDLSFASDVNPASQLGRTIDVFDWSGVTPTSAFNVASALSWDLSKLYDTGEVTLIGIGADLAGDFSGDGVVDAVDLAQWQGDFGLNHESDADRDGDSDGADFLVWQRLLAEGTSAVTTTAPVPEPESAVALALGIMLVTASRAYAVERRLTLRT
jgi:uncharacterized protein YjbI with pentapeptide repeats